MGGDQDNVLKGNLGNHIPDADSFFGVKAGDRFVQHNDLGMVQQRLFNQNTLLHFSGKPAKLWLNSDKELIYLSTVS